MKKYRDAAFGFGLLVTLIVVLITSAVQINRDQEVKAVTSVPTLVSTLIPTASPTPVPTKAEIEATQVETTVPTATSLATETLSTPTEVASPEFPTPTPTITPKPLPKINLDAFQKGVNLTLWSNDIPNEERIKEIKEKLHINSISIVFRIWMETQDSLVFRDENSLGDENLGLLIDSLHAQGLQVLVRPLLIIKDPRWWRGSIRPQDQSAWQKSYGSVMTHLAQISEEHGAERFCIGVEMNSTQEDRKTWETIIKDVRAVYSGRVIYAANWDGYWTVSFWDLVDEMHIDAFFTLEVEDDATVEQLVEAWEPYLPKIWERQAQVGKPLVLGEFGLVPQAGRWRSPWVLAIDQPLDFNAQLKYYEAARQVWFGKTKGVYFWSVGVDNSDDGLVGSFSPLGKPVEPVVKEWFTVEPNN